MRRMKNPAHPGAILQDVLTGSGVSVSEGARRVGATRANFSKIINGRGAISADMAIKIGRAFDSDPAVWLRLQANYDLARAEKKAETIPA